MGVSTDFKTAELRSYLLNQGHAESEVVAAIHHWQTYYLLQLDPDWELFELTAAGKAAVEELTGWALIPHVDPSTMG
jgi:hypothetical protein